RGGCGDSPQAWAMWAGVDAGIDLRRGLCGRGGCGDSPQAWAGARWPGSLARGTGPWSDALYDALALGFVLGLAQHALVEQLIKRGQALFGARSGLGGGSDLV